MLRATLSTFTSDFVVLYLTYERSIMEIVEKTETYLRHITLFFKSKDCIAVWWISSEQFWLRQDWSIILYIFGLFITLSYIFIQFHDRNILFHHKNFFRSTTCVTVVNFIMLLNTRMWNTTSGVKTKFRSVV